MKTKLLICVYLFVGFCQSSNAAESDKVLKQIEEHALSEWQKIKGPKEEFWNQILKNHQDVKEYYERLQTYEEELCLGLIALEQIQSYVQRCDSFKFQKTESIENKIEALKTDHEKFSEKIDKIKSSLLSNNEKVTKQDETLQNKREKIVNKSLELLEVIEPILKDAACCIVIEPETTK